MEGQMEPPAVVLQLLNLGRLHTQFMPFSHSSFPIFCFQREGKEGQNFAAALKLWRVMYRSFVLVSCLRRNWTEEKTKHLFVGNKNKENQTNTCQFFLLSFCLTKNTVSLLDGTNSGLDYWHRDKGNSLANCGKDRHLSLKLSHRLCLLVELNRNI